MATPGGPAGYEETVDFLFATLIALLILLGAAVLSARRSVTGGPRLRGLGAPVIGAVAAGLAVAFSSELFYRVADFLDRNAPTAERLASSPPLAYKWAIFGFCLAVTIAAVVAAMTALASRAARRTSWRRCPNAAACWHLQIAGTGGRPPA